MSAAQPVIPTDPAPSASRAASALHRRFTWQSAYESVIRWALFGCALLSVATTLAIIGVLIAESFVFFQTVSLGEFLTDTRWTPQFHDQHFGVLPLVLGTFQITLISGLIGLPIGLLAAIYLSEYAAPVTRKLLKPVLELLAGIPTVVYGYFALQFLTPMILKPIFQDWLGLHVDGFNALSGGIVVGVMIMPMVCSLSEDVLRAVPQSLREAGYALGSTKHDVCLRIVVPSALSGIFASFLLALARGVGETMAVAIAAGQQPQLTLNPLSQIQTMTSFVVNVMKGDVAVGSILEKSIYAVALLLFLITLLMNVVSQIVLRRYREAYQ
jgi:phosphate transport system permease protein